MFKITNLEEINKKCSRELGNKVIQKICAYIKDNIAEQYIFVRYMGPKFVIAFSGVEINGVADFVNDLKNKIENTKIYLNDEDEKTEDEEDKDKNKSKKKKVGAYPRLNFAISTYYKGTGLEEILKKQEEYLDNCDVNESDITNI